MPSYSYREAQMERLIMDADYASLYLEMSFNEALKDGFVGGFLIALENVVEAASRRQSEPSATVTLQKRLYYKLDNQANPTIESVISALEEVGLTHKLEPVSAQIHSEGVMS